MKEVIFVGLPGPTHNYGGLAQDNVASNLNRGSTSHPKEAALQALSLVQILRARGITVGILPPQLRPHLPTLKQYFSGSTEDVIVEAAKKNPVLFEKVSSSSAMWAANAATVTPGVDSEDGALHLTVANLHTNLHRRIEAADMYRLLKNIFARVPDCQVHAPLSSAQGLRDEGAANHMRLTPRHDARALNVFVYGTQDLPGDPPTARQTLSASEAVAKEQRVREAMFVKQNPAVIGQGVFHNDVIAVSNESVLLVHEAAYENGRADIERIAGAYRKLHGEPLCAITLAAHDISVEEAVHTYLFNSQIITKDDGGMAIIAPTETQMLYGGKAARLLKNICADGANPINELHLIDLRQSMHNGGGPACLRLRVPMEEAQLAAIKEHVRVIADATLLGHLEKIIDRHYPDKLDPPDISNPELYFCCRTVLMEMEALMNVGLLEE